MNNSFKRFEILSFIFTAVMGTLLHFTYEWSNNAFWVSFFSAVSESTWEHLKLLFFPIFFFAVIEYFYIGRNLSGYSCGKLYGILAGLITIVTLFYTYTGATGLNAGWFNIAIFFIGDAAAHLVSYTVIAHKKQSGSEPVDSLNPLCFTLLIILCFAFFCFTWNPPAIPLFMEP